MRKYDRKEKLGLAIIICAVLALVLILAIQVLKSVTHKLTDFSEASEEEKEALSVFYDSDIISEGKCFDLKFIYFEPCVDEAVVEIVKKTDDDLGDIVIEMWDENDLPISWEEENYGKFEESIFFWRWRQNNQLYLRILIGNDFFNNYDKLTEYKDEILIKAKIQCDECIEEKHEIRFELKKNFQELERHKKELITSVYDGQLATYYYGLLLSYDKDRWFQEVNELIDSDKNEYLDYSRILKIDACRCRSIRNGHYQGLQDLYQLSDEEYAEYQRMVKEATEKDLFKGSGG